MQQDDCSIYVKVPKALHFQLTEICRHSCMTTADVVRMMLSAGADRHDFTGHHIDLAKAEKFFSIDRKHLLKLAQAGAVPATKVRKRWHIDIEGTKALLGLHKLLTAEQWRKLASNRQCKIV